ncbi:DUF948 domain-containing protein [Planomonospora sp. ID91781]|uniref:Secreted protein n=3 Tax=Planomonospora TaxID=1998 RepID=A0A161LM91_9ACTN|nr:MULTISPECIES: DUF948 domain-containing protein [Planomonospora]MBG0824011.1 DUF948 domain-containing protein [Planomonospora sp. ID91781]GAT65676.1 secreted protein [Planomonospora sphaerica]GGK91623.1 hypothetical protein GCM10010126_58780 [Planomonospora parontospora]GII11190.1 hypothetical protein Ppa06_49880 [Planomonospora parontospora subsp. parontospora]
MLTAGEVAGLIVAVAWVVLVCFLAVVLLKLSRLLTETTKMVSELSDRAVPLLEDAAVTVNETNRQLVAVEAIVRDVKQVSGHAARVSGVAQVLVTGPMIKAVALGHGLRRAIGARGRSASGARALERRRR